MTKSAKYPRIWVVMIGSTAIITIVVISNILVSSRYFDDSPSSGTYAPSQFSQINTIPASTAQIDTRGTQERVNTTYTVVNLKACRRLTKDGDMDAKDAAGGWREIIKECEAIDPFRLFIAYYSFEPRSWINIQNGERIWTLEKIIVSEPDNQFGHFPNVADSVEVVRESNSGRLLGLVVPVDAQDEADYRVTNRQYFVIRVTKQIPCFAGRVEAVETARTLVTGAGTCKKLEERTRQEQSGG